MANKYLTPEQETEFIRQLEQESQGGVPDGGALTPGEEQQAFQEGAQMAAADAQNGQLPAVDAPAQPTDQTQTADAGAQLLSSLGFGSLEELVNAYKETLRSGSELREMLTQISALQQAMENDEQLDPNNPQDQMRIIARNEMKPVLDKQKADARNRLIQDKWNSSEAAKAADLADHMPDIQAILSANPGWALDGEGFQRAYDAARSKKYRSEKALMDDPEFLKRAASNEQVKKLVLEEHLQNIARTGDAIPQGITGGGSTPLTGKETITSMEEAKRKLQHMLGLK